MERMTPSCRKIIVALDKFIAEHNARLLQLKPKDPDFDDVEKLEQWYIGQWTDSYKQVWKRWWDENAAPLAGLRTWHGWRVTGCSRRTSMTWQRPSDLICHG